MNIFKRIGKWIDDYFGPIEITCSQCGEKYYIGAPGIYHKCDLKKVIKKAILEVEEEKLKNCTKS